MDTFTRLLNEKMAEVLEERLVRGARMLQESLQADENPRRVRLFAFRISDNADHDPKYTRLTRVLSEFMTEDPVLDAKGVRLIRGCYVFRTGLSDSRLRDLFAPFFDEGDSYFLLRPTAPLTMIDPNPRKLAWLRRYVRPCPQTQ